MIEQAAALAHREILSDADIRLEGHPAHPASAHVQTLAEAVDAAERRAIEAALTRCAGDLAHVGARAGRLRHHAVAEDEEARDPGVVGRPQARRYPTVRTGFGADAAATPSRRP